MTKNTKTKTGRGSVKVGSLPTGAKRLTKKDAKKVKGGIIAVLIGRAKKKDPE